MNTHTHTQAARILGIAAAAMRKTAADDKITNAAYETMPSGLGEELDQNGNPGYVDKPSYRGEKSPAYMNSYYGQLNERANQYNERQAQKYIEGAPGYENGWVLASAPSPFVFKYEVGTRLGEREARLNQAREYAAHFYPKDTKGYEDLVNYFVRSGARNAGSYRRTGSLPLMPLKLDFDNPWIQRLPKSQKYQISELGKLMVNNSKPTNGGLVS